MSQTVIHNRFKKSPLPSNWDIAEALRSGVTTLDELAAEHGVKVKTITKRLACAGWDAAGHPIPPWLETTPGVAVCKRCGRERKVKTCRTPDEWCQDCRAVERGSVA